MLDQRRYREGGAAQARFIAALGAALETYGFVAISHHGIADELIDAVYRSARAVFELPTTIKARYEAPEIARQRGYSPFRQEKAKDSGAADLKEFWHVGLEEPAAGSRIPDNIFPLEVPAFKVAATALFKAQEALALELLTGVERFLGAPVDALSGLARNGNSVLRVIHYPDVGIVPAGAVRAAAHEDINLLTVLPAATRPGLQICTPDGQWLPVEAPPGVMVCDTGDMMALLTGGRLPATTHRVVNPTEADGGRMSLPFFLHPRPTAILEPLAGGAAITAHDFLMTRLIETGVA